MISMNLLITDDEFLNVSPEKIAIEVSGGRGSGSRDLSEGDPKLDILATSRSRQSFYHVLIWVWGLGLCP